MSLSQVAKLAMTSHHCPKSSHGHLCFDTLQIWGRNLFSLTACATFYSMSSQSFSTSCTRRDLRIPCADTSPFCWNRLISGLYNSTMLVEPKCSAHILTGYWPSFIKATGSIRGSLPDFGAQTQSDRGSRSRGGSLSQCYNGMM